ncbi:hypothetical protein [Methanosarcina barkeri]|uniref:hypothetical protein n=1 Tax=Methanosarcina barkeri TaxID=2208 RepID=UPI00003C6840|nr:hypothetical protein [Methanosarcina barkeri]
MERCSIVVARNLGLGKKDRVQIRPSLENFLKQTIDMYGLDLSNTINVAVEKYLREKNYLTPETLETLDSCSSIEKHIFENGINSTALELNEKTMYELVSKLTPI